MYLNQISKTNCFAKFLSCCMVVLMLLLNVNVQFVKAESKIDQTESYTEIYRDSLKDYEKDIYDMIKESLIDKTNSMSIDSDYSKDEIKNIYASVLLDHPEIYYAKEDVSFNFLSYIGFKIDKVYFKYKNNQNNDYEKNLNISLNLIESYVDREKANENEKIDSIYSYFIKNVDCDEAAGDEAYNAIVMNIANELGYNKGFVYALRNLGIDSMIITGMKDNEQVSFIMAKVGDNYYFFDPVYDKLNNTNTVYLNKDDMINKGYKFYSDLNYPVSKTETKVCNYKNYNNNVLSEMNKEVSNAIKEGKHKIVFKFDNLTDYTFAEVTFKDETNLSKIKGANKLKVYTDDSEKELIVSIK